jgi:hypothetical protein
MVEREGDCDLVVLMRCIALSVRHDMRVCSPRSSMAPL